MKHAPFLSVAVSALGTRSRKMTLLAFVCFSGVSCGLMPGRPGGYYIRADGMKVPSRWSIQFTEWEGDTERQTLNYDMVYVLRSGDTGEYFIQRFWPNGRMCQWIRNTLEGFNPDAFDERTKPGRFVLEGKRLKVETVGVDETGAQFIHRIGTIHSNGDIVFERMDSSRGLVMTRFAPVDVGPMNASANW